MSNASSSPASGQTLEGFELSPQQVRRWHWQERRFSAGAHSAELLLRVPGDTDLTRLRQSLARVFTRHEILRTSYRRLPGMSLPLQVIEPEPAFAWGALELSDASEPAKQAEQARVVLYPPSKASADGLVLSLRLCALHADAASMLELASAWCAAYRGDTPSGAPLQYADYAAWRGELVHADPEAQAFWQRVLAERAPAPALPLRGHPLRLEAPVQLARLALPLPSQLLSRLCAYAEAQRLEPALLVLAAWIALAHQHSEADQLSLGIDWQARAAQLEDALGLFSEPLPLTVRALATASQATLLAALQAELRELIERRDDFPSQADEEPALLGFRYIPAPDAALAASGWSIESLAAPHAPHRLILEYREHPERPALHLHYDQNVYDQATAALLADQLLALLDSASDASQARKLSELSALSAAERQLVSERLSRSDPLSVERERAFARIAGSSSLLACFADAWRGGAHAPAVHGPTSRLSYAELDAASARLGQELLARGAGIGTRVAHFLPREADAIAGMLAILRAGAVYVPIDPDYPEQRIAFLLADCGADLILTRPALVARLPASARDEARLVFSHGSHPPSVPAGAACRDDLPWPALRPEHDAYLIYTSGSTGQPRGVPINHQSALYSLAARVAYYPDRVQDFLLLSSFAFDSSIAGLFGTLAQGGCLHLCSELEQKDPARLALLVRERGISHLLALPSLYQLLLPKLMNRAPALVAAIVAGEACPRALVDEHRRALPATRLYNEYGATEASVWSTVGECGRAEPGTEAECPVSIGRPIPHSRVSVLDERQQPVARGLKGELYLGGPGLSAGYWNQPERSREKFVEVAGERLYRSGDFGYWDERGELVFLGRADGQVKIRGYRIELAEVEAALRRVTAAEQVAVLAERDEEGQLSLRAFVERAQPLDLTDTHAALAKLLPAPMIPPYIQALPAFPRSPNGKLDRRALLALQKRSQRAAYVEPRTPAETALAKLWEELLKSTAIGRDDDFFALGGHSLLAVRLVHRIQAAFGAEISVAKVFEHSRLAALASQLDTPVQATCGRVQLLAGAGRPGAPLFCIDPTGIHLDAYQPLADRLSSERTTWGLALGPALEAAGASIERLGQELARSLRQHESSGPYRLLGWSLGGVLALALARALEQQGERVTFVGILDSQPAVRLYARGEPDPIEELAAYVDRDRSAALWALPASELHALRQRLARASADERLAEAVRWAQARDLFRDRAAPEAFVQRYALLRDAALFLNALEPGALSAPVHVWWASETLAQHGGPPVDWQRYTRGTATMELVSGDHQAALHALEVHTRVRTLLEGA